MKFNQKNNKKSIKIRAVAGKKNSVKIDDNDIVFSFSKKILWLPALFNRKLSSILLKNKNKPITFFIDSFIENYKVKCKFSLIVSILAKIDAFIEKSFCQKTNYKSNEVNIIYNSKDKNLAQLIKKACFIVNSIHLARQYQIMPSNYLSINSFVNSIKNDFKKINNKKIKIKVLTSKDLTQQKCELIQAVNKGSNEPAAMVVIEYINSKCNKNICLVGKGVMYDAGGYQLKPTKAMLGMNQDMTGASVVFATIHALASLNKNVNVIGILPLVKNLINDKSMVVNDVYHACNGRSVEITAPDAEGRLILADAIAYANMKYKISSLITVATLTGLSEISFGDYLTPFWSTNNNTAIAINNSSKLSGEYLIQLPIFDEFYELIDKSSEYADCTNDSPTPYASNSIAAAFLKTFCKCDDFTHFDIAGTNRYKKHPINPLVLTLFLYITNVFN